MITKGVKGECVTEIYCASTQGFGSGYLISPDLVLTACHVLSEDPKAPPPQDIQVRPLEDARRGRGWRDGTLIWPAAQEWSALRTYDVALVRITADDHTREIAERVELGLDQPDTGRPVEVTSVGFPRFKRDAVTGARETQQIFGLVALLSRLKGNELEIEYYKTRRPKQGEDWSGLSGAALFSGDRLMGVITFKVENGDIDFRAVRLEVALKHPSFNAIVTEAQRVMSPRAPPFPALYELESLVCLMDRDPQEQMFGPVLKEALSITPSRPLCCVIVGHRHHGPDDLITRFARDTIPRILKRPKELMDVRPIVWPLRVTNHLAALKGLRQRLWGFVSDPDEALPAEVEPFRERVNQRSWPHLFCSEIPITPSDATQAALLSAWFAFWSQLGSAAPSAQPPVHFIIVRDTEEAEVERWLSAIQIPEAMQLCVLPQLDYCFWREIGEWLEKRVKVWQPRLTENFARLQSELERELESVLARGGAGHFSISDLRTAVRSVSARAALAREATRNTNL